MMALTDISNTNKILSFKIKNDAEFFNAENAKQVPITLSFDGLSEKDQELLKTAKLHYYSSPQEDGTSCEIDRFNCYPL